MPIKGLSDRASLHPRFRNVGKLRKGATKGGGPGKDLEYFRFVPDNDRIDILKAMDDVYGTEPNHIQVYLPYDTMEENFRSFRESYGQNHLCKLRCDGELWHDWIKGDRHYHSEQGEPCTFKCKDVENRCPECALGYYGYLSVILPDLWLKYPQHIGLVTVLTTSINDIATIAAKLAQWEPLTNRPFVLWREHRTIGVPIKGKRAAKSMSLVNIELTEQEMIRAFLSTGPQRELLPERAGPEWEGDQFPSNGELETVEPGPFDQEPDHSGAAMDADAYEDWREAQEDEADNAEQVAEASAIEERRDQEIETQPSYLTPPEEGNWTAFFHRCVEELNYENPAQAAKEKDRVWLRNPQPPWADLWEHMVNVQHEKGHL